MNPLVDLLREATLQVRTNAGELLGTGFRISDNLVVTAAHVVGSRATTLEIVGLDGRVVAAPRIVVMEPMTNPSGESNWRLPDLALLSVEQRAPGSWQSAVVSDVPPQGELVGLGYVRGLVDDITLDVATLGFEGPRKEAGVTVFKLNGGRIEPGMSGGPVLDLNRGLVVAWIKADRGDDLGAFAVGFDCLRDFAPSHWAEALTSGRRNTLWSSTRRQGITARIDDEVVGTYLDRLVEVLSRASSLLPPGVTRDHVRQPVRLRRITGDASAQSVSVGFAQTGSDTDDPESFIWDPARAPWPTVGVVAGPGMGKSWMLTYHARSLATLCLRSLDGVAAGESRIPVLVEASNLARLLPQHPNRDEARSALAASAHRLLEGEVSEAECEAMFEFALANRRLVVCVDGLDEVSMELRPRLADALKLLGPQLEQLIVSARDSARQALQELFPRGFTEFRIDGFTIGDARRFVEGWHRDDPDGVASVTNDLRSFPHLRSLARVPLLLGFICRLAAGEGGKLLPATRSDLYREVATGLLSGRWREESARRAESAASDPVDRLNLLAEAVGQLTSGWRQRPDVVFRSDLKSIIASLKRYPDVEAAARERWRSWQAALNTPDAADEPEDYVLWEYVYDGFLLPRLVDNRPALAFIHQVFAELCLAIDLASRPPAEVAVIVEEHRWFDDEWADVFPISCGIDVKRGAILAALAHQAADPWLSQGALEARCIAEVGGAVVASARAGQLQRLLAHLRVAAEGTVHTDAWTAVRSIIRLVDARIRPATNLAEELVDSGALTPDLRLALILRLAPAGSEVGVREAIALVEEGAASAEDLLSLVVALGESSSDSAIAFLTQQLRLAGADARLAAAMALAHGDQLAIDAALNLAKRADVAPAVRSDVIVALIDSGVGDSAALGLVLDEGVSRLLRCRVVRALLRVGAEVKDVDVEALVADPNVTDDERIELVRALLLRGDEAMLKLAADLVTNLRIEHHARFELARTMASISSLGANALRKVATAQSVRSAERLQGLRALLERRDQLAVDEALALLASGDEPDWLRFVLLRDLLDHAADALASTDVRSLLQAVVPTEPGNGREIVIAAMVRSRDRAVGLLGRELFAKGVDNPLDVAGGAVDPGILLDEVARAGEAGVELLLELALQQSRPTDLRVRAAVAAAQADPQAGALGVFLEDTTVDGSVRSRLTVALAVLGCCAAFQRLLDLLPQSEPAYMALGALLTSPNATRAMVDVGVPAATESQLTLARTSPPIWDADYEDEVLALQLTADSDAERRKRVRWAAQRLRGRVDGRLLSLLVPAERVELYRVGKFEESPETRNWLARWIPEYRQIIAEELERIRSEIERDPTILPVSGQAQAPLTFMTELCQLLDEWVEASRSKRWPVVAHLIVAYEHLLGHEASIDLLSIAAGLGEGWPLHTAHLYLARLAAHEHASEARLLLLGQRSLFDEIRRFLDAGEFPPAFEAAALAVLMDDQSAVSWFYASCAAASLELQPMAEDMMRSSAKFADAKQACQGRRTLLSYTAAGITDHANAEVLREILGTVEGARELEALQSRGAPTNAEAGTETRGEEDR